MVKIFIDPGHGGIDSGATGNGLLEKNITLSLALAIRKFLSEYKGVSIRMSRTTDKTVTLTERTNMANNWDADFYLSIHINAGGGTGFESFIYSGLSTSSKTGQRRNTIHNRVASVNGMQDRGKKRANFHVLRETIMSAVLTENGFIDTRNDANKMKNKEWRENVARAHAQGIVDIFNLKRSVTASSGSNKIERYTLSESTGGYYTAADAKNRRNRRTTVPRGSYYVYNRSDGMINVSKSIDSPGSWINPKTSKGSSHRSNFQVGDRVRIKLNADRYATGERIPAWVKNRAFTIQQIKSDQVLLQEIYSWVNKTDIIK